jgi:hypothetical protein
MRTLRQQQAVHHPIFARCYARVGHLMDTEISDHRRRLLAGYLTGGGVWNPVLAGWTYAGDLLVWGAWPFRSRSPS